MARNRKKEWDFYKPLALDVPLVHSYLSAVLQALAAVPSFNDIFQAHREEFKEGPMTAALRHFLYLAHTAPQDYLVEPRGIAGLVERRDARFGVRTTHDPAEALDTILGCILEELHAVENQSVLAPRFSRFQGIMALPDLEVEHWKPAPDRYITKVVVQDATTLKQAKGGPKAATSFQDDFGDPRGDAPMPVGCGPLKPAKKYVPMEKPDRPARRISSIATPRGYRILHEELARIPEPFEKKGLTEAQKAMLRAFGIEPKTKDPVDERTTVGDKRRWCPLEEVAVRGQYKKCVMGATVWGVTCNKSGARIPTSYLAHFLLPVPVVYRAGERRARTLEECLRAMAEAQPFDGSGKLWSAASIRWHRLLRHGGAVRVELEHIPRVLMLQLQRFAKLPDGRMAKAAPRVQFDEALDISDVVAPHLEGRDLTYRLVAVIAHVGDAACDPSLYEAYVRGGDGAWHRTCCGVAHPVERQAVLACDAYILVYEKRHFTWNEHVAQSELPQEHLDIIRRTYEVQHALSGSKTSHNK